MTTTTLRMTAAGIVLAMASSAQAALITPTGATASSTFVTAPTRVPSRTIDSSGLTGDGSAGSTHSAASANGRAWNTTNTDTDPEITFDLGGIFTVDTMRIWNFNDAGGNGTIFGSNSVTVLTSTDDVTYTSQGTFTVAQASGLATYTGADYDVSVLFGSDFSAQYIRFDILSNYNGVTFGTGSTDFVGLSEIRFEGTASVAPEPTSLVLAFMGITGLVLGRRRRNR